MEQEQKSLSTKLIQYIAGILGSFFLIQLILGAIIVYQVPIKQTSSYIQKVAQRVKEDISYKNGKWDMYRYNADPQLPDTYPLYVLAADGFVLDRWKPLHGFLDTSDFSHLLTYTSPQTVTTASNQTWRMYSKPILKNNATMGVITTAYFNPQEASVADVDRKLMDTANTIASRVTFKNDQLISENIDVRDISYDISFQVVDKFNRILAKNNNNNSIDRIPNFTDASYVGNEINSPRVRQVQDAVTHEKFLIVSSPVVDANNFVIGVVVVGKSIAYIDEIFRNFLISELVAGIVLVVIGIVVIVYVVKDHVRRVLAKLPVPIKAEIRRISFDKKESILRLDQHEIHIPYATNQYYLCEALFSQPKKRWEVDELLERFGEDIEGENSWRKVYDAMLIVDKKLGDILDEKLIITRDKTYQINPQFVPIVM